MNAEKDPKKREKVRQSMKKPMPHMSLEHYKDSAMHADEESVVWFQQLREASIRRLGKKKPLVAKLIQPATSTEA